MSEKQDKPFSRDMPFDEALTRFARTNRSELRAATGTKAPTEMDPKQGELELIHYETPECASDFSLDSSNETVWAMQKQIVDVFGIDRSGVAKNLRDVFSEGNEADRIDEH